MKAQADETDFNRILDSVLSGAKAKRKSAVIAELKLDDLKASKNREADIRKAVEELVSNEETAFLFESAEAKPTGSKVNFPGGTGASGNDAAVLQARAIMGLPTNQSKE